MNIGLLILLFFTMLLTSSVHSETIYVDVKKGNDNNPGTKELPLKTITKAVDLVNNSDSQKYSNIKIYPGLYSLEKECLIKNNNPYNEKNRLIIEAANMPDDKDWKPEDMPIIVSAYNPPVIAGKKYIESSGFDVEVSHVTIRGLKFIGLPIPGVFYYPIYRTGGSLDDLVVSQCMFICDPQVAASNVAVVASGHGLKIDHSVFYGCSNAVVFWNADDSLSRGNSMTNCIIDGSYVSGVWLCQTGEDFEFHNNIITNCKYAFMRSEDNKKTYSLNDCIINNNEFYSGKCTVDFELSETGNDVLYKEKNIIKTGNVQLEKAWGLDMGITKNHLNVIKLTQGSELSAGLFKE